MMLFESLEPRQHFATGHILFIRGATRSGGFLEASTPAARDAQLADINDTSAAPGNSGWGTLAADLRAAGYTVSQMIEAKEKVEDGSGFTMGRPIRFETMDLSQYDTIVFGSNNARYAKESVDAVDNYIRNGGGAIFISDANFGSNWRDAADSDQRFLARYSIIVNQDAAIGTTLLARGLNHFASTEHPILRNVHTISGEGVSYLTRIWGAPVGESEKLISATGQARNNDGVDPANKFQGTLRTSNVVDAALLSIKVGLGRVATYFDRNTFFNANGLGTDITRDDNRTLALNLFNWVADKAPPQVVTSTFTPGAPHELKIFFDDRLEGLSRSDLQIHNPFDATPLPRTRWGWALDEVDGKSVLSIRVKAATPPGIYQFQINANKFTDDAGNSNSRRIRVNFTIA